MREVRPHRDFLASGELALQFHEEMARAKAAAAGAVDPAWAPRAVLGIAANRMGATPMGVTSAWVGMIVLIGFGFVLAARQFRRMEIPTRTRRFTLVSWSREEG